MGEFYRMTRKRLRRQVVEFVDVRGFDDPQLDDLLQLVLLAEERPPKQLEFSLRRIDRMLFNGDDRRALGNENVLAWVKEIG